MRKDWTYTSARAGYRRIFMMTEGPAWETLFGDGRQWHWDTRRGKSTPAGERPSAAGPLLPVALAAGQRIGSRPPYLYRFWSRCAFRVVRCVRRADALLESSFAHRRSASRGESAAPRRPRTDGTPGQCRSPSQDRRWRRRRSGETEYIGANITGDSLPA